MALRNALPGALGGQKTDAGLEKLTIRHEETTENSFTGEIRALFNPNKILMINAVEWEPRQVALPADGEAARQVTNLRLKKVKPGTLTIDLFFDTYEGNHSSLSLGQSIVEDLKGTPLALFPGARPAATDVTRETEQVAQLTRINRELHRPPICELHWGEFRLFRGVLSNLKQNFTLFLPNGTPVRATLTCVFTQFTSEIEGIDVRSPNVPKTRIIRRGDTLSHLAAREYNDPTAWRAIAKANGIHNPRFLVPGQILKIPKLRS